MRDQLLQRQNAQQQRSQKVRGPSRDTAIPGREIGRQFWTKYSSVVCDLAVCFRIFVGKGQLSQPVAADLDWENLAAILLTELGCQCSLFCFLDPHSRFFTSASALPPRSPFLIRPLRTHSSRQRGMDAEEVLPMRLMLE